MNSYNQLVVNQAGDRIVIKHKKKDSCCTCSTHYKNFAEFLGMVDIESLEWYQIKDKERTLLRKCDLCGRTHTDGTCNNCT